MNQMIVRADGRNQLVSRGGTNHMRGSNSGGDNISSWLEEDFSSYANETEVQASAWYTAAPWQDTVWNTTDGMSLDLTEGYGTSDRCLKTSFPSGAYDIGGRTVNMGLPFSIADYWTEIWAKVSTTFDSNGSNANNPDYKFVFWALQSGDGRNEIKIGNGGTMNNLDTRYDNGPDTFYIAANNTLNSGIWHRYRVHNKVATGGGSIFSVEFWDGTNVPQLLEQDGFSLSFTSMNYIVLGANRNKIALVDMWIKWGKITLYNTNPGWGF